MPVEATDAARRGRLGFSIKGRLVGLFVLLALATTTVFLLGMQRLLHGGWQSYVQPLATDYVDRLAAEIGTPPDPARARALAARLPIAVRIEGPVVNIDTQPHRRWGHHHREEAARDASGDDETGSEAWSLVRLTSDGHRITFGLARPPDGLRPRLVGWATLAVLLALTLLAYAAVRRLLAPLEVIGVGVEAYGCGEFATPIVVQRRDELGALAGRINGMAANLHGMLEAKRALLLAISHELRSPLTRARVNVELLEDGAPRSALLDDLAEMRDLIDNLLESERLAQGHAALHPEPTDLAALAADVVSAQFGDRGVQLQLDELGSVQADPMRLRLLLRNLIDNALRHGAEAQEAPVVFLRREVDGRVALGVRDHGPGVAADQAARLGEAFYRPDAARTRAAGGVGLGLALARAVARAHGGELRIRRVEPGLEVSAVWSPVR
ncbi:MAG: HAMP domain-containing protein [Proteobacteria bacterium]|nr:HAMP domain-containing protein [Pseudomonadota bacterium]